MNCSKKISVCIPFYNIESYACRCLDSVLANTYKNLEIICVNDGSTDGTSALLHRYAERDPRVIVIDKENGGVVSARNTALDNVTGDFISFVDGDDWIHHQFFEVLMSVQEKADADIVICGYKKTDHVVEDPKLDVEHLPYTACGLNCVPENRDVRALIWGRIYSSELIPSLRADTDIVIGEDAVLNILFLCKRDTTRIAVTAEKLYYYYQRPNSLVHTLPHRDRIKVCNYFVKNADAIKSCCGHYGQQIIIYEILRSMFSYRYLEMFSPNQENVRKCCEQFYTFCVESWGNVLPKKERVKYTILYHCPTVYRLFRIMTDPTMLDWERAEKKRRREQKQG